jgi:ribA/ribD-fused uncharacterized protein
MAGTIHFYAPEDEYGDFSNHSRHPVRLKGKVWPTTEHYFQAQKFVGSEHEETIRNEPDSHQAAELGRDRSKPLRADWNEVKDQLMREAVLAKFSQHADIRAGLLATGDAQLVEHTEKDKYWGDGGDGSGLNMLGKILMEVRATLANQTPNSLT